MTILDQLADHARKRVIANMEECSLNVMRELAMLKSSATGVPFAFEQALRKEDVNFICECKKASPSKGLIAPNFPYLEIAKEYEVAGADCISVLTEPKWFLGNDEYLKEIAEAVSIPCLRKDFTVDEYQIYQAKVLGASAVLLICSILTEDQMKDYIRICDNLGLSALVEAHDEQEVQTALNTGARIIGVNNRNLKDFSVDTDNGVTGTASFKCEGAAGITKYMEQTVTPSNRDSYTFSAQIATENLSLGSSGQVGVEIVIEYEDGSTETRTIDLISSSDSEE